jgi:hypothetical protein
LSNTAIRLSRIDTVTAVIIISAARPPYLHREKTRRGKMVWVVRRNGKRRQLRSAAATH